MICAAEEIKMEEGEWWLDEDGYATFADGDVGDANHEMIAWESFIGIDEDTQSRLRKKASALLGGHVRPDVISMTGIDWTMLGLIHADEENIDVDADNEDLIEELGKKYFVALGGDLDFAENGANDARGWAIEKHNWIRVADNNFQMWTFDDDALKRIKAHEGWESEDETDEDSYATISEQSTGLWWDVPFKELLEAVTVNGIKRLVPSDVEPTMPKSMKPIRTSIPTRSRPGEEKWEYGIGDNPLLRTKAHDDWALDMKVNAVVKMHPEDFLWLTTTSEEHQEKIYDEAQPLSKYNEYVAAGQNLIPPVLYINASNGLYRGAVVGHEGRHRASALLKNGEHEMDVSLILRGVGDTSHSREGSFGGGLYPSRQSTILDLPDVLYGEFEGSRRFDTEQLLGIVQSNVQEQYQKPSKLKNGPMTMDEFYRLKNSGQNPPDTLTGILESLLP
jgi:hypothetical protein